MKRICTISLYALFVVASVRQASAQSACGPGTVSFKVKLESRDAAASANPTAAQPATSAMQPEAGKALVYFFHDAGTDSLFAYPTTKMGIDGAWAGANHGNSWFAVSVLPGEHHVCATLQSSLVDNRVELAHFRAEAGGVYYFRTRLVMSRTVEMLDLDAIDSDEGQYLMAAYPLSVATAKK